MSKIIAPAGNSSFDRLGGPFLMGSGYNGRDSHIEPATPVARCVPLPEALMSSISPSLVASRITRELLFCPEAKGEGPSFGRHGKVIGIGLTFMLSKSFRYSKFFSFIKIGWTGMLMRSQAWDSLTGSLEAAKRAVILAGEEYHR